MSSAVYIVSVGARTPVGLRADSTAAAVRAGISRIQEHPLLTTSRGKPLMAAMDAQLPAEMSHRTRLEALAQSALEEVAHGFTSSPTWEGGEVPLVLGLPEAPDGLSEDEAREVCGQLAATPGPGLQWSIIGRQAGHAAALEGIQLALTKLRRGEWPLCVVGGVDSNLRTTRLDALERAKRLLVDDGRSSFIPGEGAAFVALARADVVQRLKLAPLALVRGAGSASEPKHMSSGATNLGEALAAAIAGAMAGMRLPNEAVDAVYCDLNGERFRSEEWGFAALRLPTAFRDPAGYVAPSHAWGDVGAAAGALSAVLAVQSWRRGYARGPHALLCASSEGPLRAAVTLERPS